MGCGSDIWEAIEEPFERAGDEVERGAKRVGDELDRIGHDVGDYLDEYGHWLDDHIYQPLAEFSTGETFWNKMAEAGVVSDGFANSYGDVMDTVGVAAMAIGGVIASPFTGGASLGLTYGALSAAGLALASGSDWNDAMSAGLQGGAMGAVTSVGSYLAAPYIAAGTNALANAGARAGGGYGTMVGNALATGATHAGEFANNYALYGTSGTAGSYAATGDLGKSALFGLGSAIGAQAYGMGGTMMTMASAGATGIGLLSASGEEGGGGGGGGTVGHEDSASPGQVQEGQSIKKTNPSTEFLDPGEGAWGQGGIGGVFGGLDDLKTPDTLVNPESIRKKYTQRKAGAFLRASA